MKRILYTLFFYCIGNYDVKFKVGGLFDKIICDITGVSDRVRLRLTNTLEYIYVGVGILSMEVTNAN